MRVLGLFHLVPVSPFTRASWLPITSGCHPRSWGLRRVKRHIGLEDAAKNVLKVERKREGQEIRDPIKEQREWAEFCMMNIGDSLCATGQERGLELWKEEILEEWQLGEGKLSWAFRSGSSFRGTQFLFSWLYPSFAITWHVNYWHHCTLWVPLSLVVHPKAKMIPLHIPPRHLHPF